MPPEKTHNKSQGVVALVIVVIVLLAFAYFISKLNIPTNTDSPGTSEGTPGQPGEVTKEAITTTMVDVSAATTPADKLPKGFPSSIPVESKNILTSASQVYTDRTPNETVYSVSYQSDKTPAEKYSEYLAFMTKDGYTFSATGKNAQNHSLYGTKGNTILLVTASTNAGKTVVQINYAVSQ